MIIQDNCITADEGKVLTNGDYYFKHICLGVNDSADNWSEITDEEYAKVLKEQKEKSKCT
ncbi:MAG: hypothetical protein J6J13_01390 [Clostridia bacterium]|nr:hypothetical protein [Clostridia bacterium]